MVMNIFENLNEMEKAIIEKCFKDKHEIIFLKGAINGIGCKNCKIFFLAIRNITAG